MPKPHPVAIVAADTHIDEFIWSTRTEIRGDAFFGFSQLVDKAINEQLPLIIAGDFIECLPVNYPTSVTISALLKELRKLEHAGIPFYFVNGQHDGSISSTVPWPVAIGFAEGYHDFSVVELDKLKVTLLSHRPKQYLADVLEEIQPCDLVICHQVWSELMGGRSCEGSITDLPAKLVISGDYHQFKSVKLKRTNGDVMRAVSPGATHIRKITEPSIHYGVKLYSDLSVKRFRLKSRKVVHATVRDKSGLHQLLEMRDTIIAKAKEHAEQLELPPNLVTPLLAIQDSSAVPDVLSSAENAYGGWMHVHYRRQTDIEEIETTGSQISYKAADAISQALEYECKEQPEVLLLLSQLLNTEKPKALLDKMRKQLTET